ncbi:hypothetical protein ACFS5N_15335 [Mucilaginibacter ximonensis]|uniref:O-antigen ligase-like membrane protein n=1 Tax=Mucilaginibacter ximonensis TaxID=538021 RepID=A0ABW5YER7_9SPHI
MKNYIFYSTLIGIFTERLFVHVGIDIKLIYGIFFINYLILLAFNKIIIPKFLFYIVFYLAVTSIIACVFKTDQPAAAIAQLLGISVSMLYFYNIYRYTDLDIETVFDKYLQVSFYLSAIGILIFVFEIVNGHFDYRLQSLMNEPAHFSGIIAPAFYYSLKKYKQSPKRFYVIALALILSGSSVGYICILLSAIIYNKKIFVLRNLIIYCAAAFLGLAAYLSLENVRMRVDDTAKSSASLDVTGANLSTYALISNLFVTQQVLMHNPVTGNGLGSHKLSHQKYIGDLTGNETFDELQDLNAEDANSLLLRVLSDLGLVGAFFVFRFIGKFYLKQDDWYILSRAVLIYFFYKLFREGHYFSPEMYFFVFMYYFHYQQKMKNNLDLIIKA